MSKGFEEMKDELCEGIEKDLGRGAFYGYISEIHLIKVEIQHTIDHLKAWMKETVVDTPILVGPGKSSLPKQLTLLVASGNHRVPSSI